MPEDELDLILASLPPIAGGAPGILDDIWDILQGVYRLITDPYGTIVQPIADWVRRSLADAYREVYGQAYASLLPETLAWITPNMDGYPIPAILMGIAKLIWHRIIDPVWRWFRELKADTGTFFSKLWERIYQVPLGFFRQAYQWVWDWAIGSIPEDHRWMFPRETPTWGVDQYAGKMFTLLWLAILFSFRSVWRNVNAVWERVYNVPLSWFRKAYEWQWNHLYIWVPDQDKWMFPREMPGAGLDEYAGKTFTLLGLSFVGVATRAWQSFYDWFRDSHVDAYNTALGELHPDMLPHELGEWPALPQDASVWTAVRWYLKLFTLRGRVSGRRTEKALGDMGDNLKKFVEENIADPILDAVKNFFRFLWEGVEGLWTLWIIPLFKMAAPGLWDQFLGATRWMGDKLKDAITPLFEPLEDLLTSHSPIEPEDSLAQVRGLSSALIAGVAGLAGMVLAGELIHPLKQVGLGRIAAMLWDQTNFAMVTGAYVGGIVTAAIRTPFGHFLNRHFRPSRPGIGDLMPMYARNRITQEDFRLGMSYQGLPEGWIDRYEKAAKTYPPMPDLAMMYAKKEIREGQFDEWMGAYGLEQKMLDVYHRYIWLDPRLTELIRIAQLYRPPEAPAPAALTWLDNAGVPLGKREDWWFTYKIAKAGYEAIDIPILVEVAKLGLVRREQTLYFEAARRLFRDGLIRRERVEELTTNAWVSLPPVEYRMQAIDLDVEYAQKAATVQIILRAYTRGLLDESDTMGLLGDIGMDGTRVRLNILREKMGLLPTVRLAPPSEPEEPILGGD